jgi:signal transduction histidine kinase/HAMP domain-containing protein
MIRRYNLKTILELSFGLMLFFVLVLGSIAYSEIKSLSSYTRLMYRHSLKVSDTSRDIKNEILSIESSLKSIGMDDNLTSGEITDHIQNIDLHDKKIYQYFQEIYSNYLGPKADVDSAFLTYQSWSPLRNEVIHKKQLGLNSESYTYFKENRIYREKLFNRIETLIRFSTSKADSLYAEAKSETYRIIFHNVIVFAILFLLTIAIVYFLIRHITHPLKELTDITIQYGQGNYSLRSNYKSNNEIGILASAFNSLASSIEEELSIKNEISKIAALLLSENDIKPFCRKMLDAILSATGSNSGAVYLFNDKDSNLNVYQTGGINIKWYNYIGIEAPKPFNKLFSDKKLLHLDASSADYDLPGFTEKFYPKEVLSFPFLENNNLIGAVILFSNSPFSSFAVKLTTEIRFRLNANLNRVLSFKKLNDFSSRIDEQYRMLEIQSKALEIHSRELAKKNDELKIAKEHAELSDRLKTTFLLNMSHELRTPLNSIIGFSGILMQQLPGPLNKEQKKQIKMIQSSGCHLLSLINDILDISKIEAGEIKPELETFDVNQVIEEVMSMVWPFASNKNLPVHFNPVPGSGEIKSDRKRVHQIILNIVNNAVKFTEKGSIDIRCFTENGFCKVEIADTGIGIKTEDINLLFNPFVQLENNLTRKFEGSGLGLSISKKLMEMLKGDILVESEYGKGTRFILSFPV